jgi:hypothetical protein
MSGNSLQHCEERIRFFEEEYRANQERATRALKELKWWQDERVLAQKAEAERASRDRTH